MSKVQDYIIVVLGYSGKSSLHCIFLRYEIKFWVYLMQLEFEYPKQQKKGCMYLIFQKSTYYLALADFKLIIMTLDFFKPSISQTIFMSSKNKQSANTIAFLGREKCKFE